MQKIGWLSSILLVLCGVPELYTAVSTGIVGSSYGLVLLWFLGEFLGLIYVIPKKDKILLLNYGINTIITGFLLYYKVGAI